MIGYLIELFTSWAFKPILLWSGRQWFGFIIIGSFFWASFNLIFEILLLRLAITTNKKKRRTKDGGKKFKIN